MDDDAGCGCRGRSQDRRLWSYFLSRELRRLHTARKTAFDPELPAHERLLRMTWSALRSEPYVRTGAGWKEIGFQAEDPASDVRAGGLLAMQCLAHFAVVQTNGMRMMLRDIQEAERLHESDPKTYPQRYYPVATSGIVLCAKLCDALGLSDGMRGAIPEAALAKLLASPPTASPLAPFLWSSFNSWALGRRGGFFGLFSLVFSDFHAQFVAQGLGYMQAQELLAACVGTLQQRAQAARKPGTFDALRRLYVEDANVPQIVGILDERTESVRKLRAAGDAVRLVLLRRASGSTFRRGSPVANRAERSPDSERSSPTAAAEPSAGAARAGGGEADGTVLGTAPAVAALSGGTVAEAVHLRVDVGAAGATSP